MLGESDVDIQYFAQGLIPVRVGTEDTERFMTDYRALCAKYGLVFGPAMTVDRVAVVLLYRDPAIPTRQ